LSKQEECLSDLPGEMEKAVGKVKQAETRLKAIRALQPDWARLSTLRNDVLPETEGRVTQLAARANQEADAAGALQVDRSTVQKRVEVQLFEIFYAIGVPEC
jgi:hypothetical protein